MAIFGDLANMSTPEVFKMLGTRTGKLYIWPTPQKEYELHLHEGAVRYFREDGASLSGGAALQKGLQGLFGLHQGKFDFSQETPSRLSHELNFTRQEVWQLLAATELTPEATDEHVPTDKATRFKLSGLGHRNSASELPENLQTFFERARALLTTGSSAGELADALEMHLPLVQLYLMRLRSLDQITPVRAYAPGYSYDAGFSSAPSTALAGEARAPLTPLRPELTQTQTPAAQQPATPYRAQQSTVQQDTVQQNTAQQVRPKQNFVRRLISALSFGGK